MEDYLFDFETEYMRYQQLMNNFFLRRNGKGTLIRRQHHRGRSYRYYQLRRELTALKIKMGMIPFQRQQDLIPMQVAAAMPIAVFAVFLFFVAMSTITATMPNATADSTSVLGSCREVTILSSQLPAPHSLERGSTIALQVPSLSLLALYCHIPGTYHQPAYAVLLWKTTLAGVMIKIFDPGGCGDTASFRIFSLKKVWNL
jgi:hypothetical protein